MSTYPPEKAGQPGSATIPTRSTGETTGYVSDDEAVSDAKPSDTIGLLLERLQAWKHACGYLESYISATEKLQKHHAKEYDRVLKTISDPLKEGHHFDQSLGGVAGFFENMRSNTQAVANSHIETSKSLEGSVLPILKRLHGEIKNKNKELSSGAGKSAKAVDAARNATQKHIELLGQHSAAFDSTGGKPDSHNDPYVVRRNIQHSLHKQVLEENNSRQDLISVQRNFEAFEAHVLQTIQQAMGSFLQFVGGRSDREKAIYSDIVGTVQRIPHEFEWMNFLHRNGDMMIDPSAPPREVSHISYPNQDHASAKPLIAGTLERKGRGVGSLTGYKTGFYVVTPSKYFHQFADDDDFRKDPTPELSLYLPDCTIGAVSDTKFHIKGKDASKGKVGSAFQMTHELSFKAHTPADAQKWHAVMTQSVGSHTNDLPPDSAATSPTSPTDKHPTPLQTGNLSHGQTTGSAGPQTSSTTNTNVTPSSAAPATGNPTTPATSTTMSPGAGALGKETF